MSDLFYLGAFIKEPSECQADYELNTAVTGNIGHVLIAYTLIHGIVRGTIKQFEEDSHVKRCEACTECLDVLRLAYGVLDQRYDERMQGFVALMRDRSPKECEG